MLMPFMVFSQTKKEVIDFNNSIVLPFNKVTNTILTFNTALLQGENPSNLIGKRDAVLNSLKSLDKALSTTKIIEKDYGLLNATKGGAKTYEDYFKNNFTNEKLSLIPATARENIKKIKDGQKAAQQMEVWNNDFFRRQKKLFEVYKIDFNMNDSTKQRVDEYKKVMKYYYDVSLNELKVQVFVDEFVSAYNSSENEQIKIAQEKLKTQLLVSEKYLNSKNSFKNDNSLIEESKKVTSFYSDLSKGLIKDVIRLNSFPVEIPNEKVDEYNMLVDKVNNGVEFLNTLQSKLNDAQLVIDKFFQTHL